MKRLWQKSGTIAFWLSWPLLYLYLRASSRTRLIVLVGDQVLVMKSWLGSGRWALPGGGLHRGEDPKQGALRELREETGLTAQPDQLQPLLEATYRQNGLRFKYRCFVLQLSETMPLTPQRFEVLECRWLDRAQLSTENAGQDVCQALTRRFGD